MTKNTKGQSRAPGPTVQEVLKTDVVPPPAALIATEYAFLGDEDLDAKRYTDPPLLLKKSTRCGLEPGSGPAERST